MAAHELNAYVKSMMAYSRALQAQIQQGADSADSLWLIQRTLRRLDANGSDHEESLVLIHSLARLMIVRDLPPRSQQHQIATEMYRLAKSTLHHYRGASS